MGKTKKTLAWLLALSMALNGGSALAKKKESAATAKPATTIEEETTIPSIEDLCLPEECIAFLNQNNIQIVDGNIIVDSAEKINLIAQYYQGYFTNLGRNVGIKAYNEFISSRNMDGISENTNKELESGLYITTPVKNYFSNPTNGLMQIVDNFYDKKAECILKSSVDNYPSILPVIFDYKLRQTLAHIESYEKAFIVSDNRKSKVFVEMQEDILKFLEGEKSSFPYRMDELGEFAIYVLYFPICQFMGTITTGNGQLSIPFATLLFDEKYTKQISETVMVYVDSFPTQPPVKAKK